MRCFLAAVVVLTLWSCTSTPPPAEHHYLLHLPCQVEPRDRPGEGPAFAWCRVEAINLARGNAIWARVSPVEVQQWRHHRWALPVPQMVKQAAYDWARCSGHFATVEEVVAGAGNWYCNLVIEHFEEVDRDQQWFARVTLKMELIHKTPEGHKKSWHGRLEKEIPARRRNPEELVLAFGRALEELLETGFKFARFGAKGGG